jgi:hypothetical protein
VLAPGHPREFASTWIRECGRLHSRELLSLSDQLGSGTSGLLPLAPEIVEALASLKTPEGNRALAHLAVQLRWTLGPRVVAVLSGLGAVDELLDITRKPLPGPLRALATKALVEATYRGNVSGGIPIRRCGSLHCEPWEGSGPGWRPARLCRHSSISPSEGRPWTFSRGGLRGKPSPSSSIS